MVDCLAAIEKGSVSRYFRLPGFVISFHVQISKMHIVELCKQAFYKKKQVESMIAYLTTDQRRPLIKCQTFELLLARLITETTSFCRIIINHIELVWILFFPLMFACFNRIELIILYIKVKKTVDAK